MEYRSESWYLDRAEGRKVLASHQLRILQQMEDQGSLGIFAEAGTGKTMIALTYIYRHILDGQLDHALVVCPASLIDSWKVAMDRMAEFGYTQVDIDLVKDAVNLVSYNRIWIKNPLFRKRGQRKYIIRPEIDHQWDAVFFDESHRLGDPTSVQTKVALLIAGHTGKKGEHCPRLSDHFFVMTGTPDSLKYVKLYGQLSVLDPTLFETYYDFDKRYVIAKDFFNNPIRYDVDALEALKRRYGTVARLRECFDMPESTETDIPVHMTPEQTRIYKDMLHLKGDRYGVNFQTAGVGSMKALQTCCGFYYDDAHTVHYIKNGRLDALRTIIEGRDDKIVIFCQYTPTMDMLMDALSSYDPIRFDGSVKDAVWTQFQNDPSKRMIIIQYQRGAEGIDLFSSCCMVFFEPTSSAYTLEQAHARIMRKGQQKNCTFYYIYTLGTIESKSLESVRRGMDVSRELLDKWFIEEQVKYGIEPTRTPSKNENR